MSISLHDRVTVTSTEYGLVLLDERAGEYWNLNPTGAFVLDALLGGATPAAAATALAAEHPVDVDTATRDVDELLAQLRDANLVADGQVRA